MSNEMLRNLLTLCGVFAQDAVVRSAKVLPIPGNSDLPLPGRTPSEQTQILPRHLVRSRGPLESRGGAGSSAPPATCTAIILSEDVIMEESLTLFQPWLGLHSGARSPEGQKRLFLSLWLTSKPAG